MELRALIRVVQLELNIKFRKNCQATKMITTKTMNR
jgi:hypothetical protein